MIVSSPTSRQRRVDVPSTSRQHPANIIAYDHLFGNRGGERTKYTAT